MCKCLKIADHYLESVKADKQVFQIQAVFTAHSYQMYFNMM